MKKQLLELRVNGRSHELAIEPNRLLLDALRLDLQLTGSKRGCDDSSCGACAVLIDGIPMLSCTMLAASCEGQEITTVEGLSEHGALAAIQKAYGDWGGAQCGFCTPGFMMTVKHLLATNPNPTDAEIRNALSSNLCRCTGYSQMYEAIKAAIEAEQKGMAARTLNTFHTFCHSERRRSFACGRSSQSRNLLFSFALWYGFCAFVGTLFPASILAQELPQGWRHPTKAEASDKWRMKSPTRFVTVKGDFDGDGKRDVAELLVNAPGQQCALFVWLSSQGENPPEPIWQAEKGGLSNFGIRVVHPGKYETLCSADPSSCDPQTPTSVNLKNYGIEFFSHGETSSFAYWDEAGKKFQWVPMGD